MRNIEYVFEFPVSNCYYTVNVKSGGGDDEALQTAIEIAENHDGELHQDDMIFDIDNYKIVDKQEV